MIGDFADTFKNRTVLVTGHTGFKGTWLTIWLKMLGAKVIGYSLDPITKSNLYDLSGIADQIIDIRGDIRDSQAVEVVFQQYRPEIVFHLAAQPLVKYSYVHPKETYDVNVMGTLNILEAIRKTDETKIGIFITTDKCYENKEWVWGYRENDPVGGYDPYSSSKACCELLIASYRNSYFNENQFHEHGKVISTVRAGNVIGGGDWAEDRIIPDSIRALEKGKPISIRSPKSIRPWQHVLEPLSGYLLLTSQILSQGPEFSGAWNFGPGDEGIISVENLVSLVVENWGEGIWTIDQQTDVHEAKLLSLDISKAKHKLNWTPRWGINETIEKTVHWYKSYKNCEIFSLCTNQIEEYCSK
ncbi:CDP-glucose 4,6-dehydratase [Metabacillus litoralis]|uniref:CDP-glucose 4,6-dehydratase n=1 Tax=Metabacillus litoralis TaxID=152268 RepID=UPI001CFDA597|nr:CDP-glucose 4,6-dehydratase [Metabacillus litoralis]